MKRWLVTAVVLVTIYAFAHEVRPAFLQLIERAPGEFDVTWKVPAMGGAPLAGDEIAQQPEATASSTRTMPCGCPAPTETQLARTMRGVLAIHPTMPANSAIVTPPHVERIFGAEIKQWTIRTGPEGIEGWEVGVHGLSATMVDVLVRIEFKDGRVVSRMLRPDAPSFVLTKETVGPAAGGYFWLGVEHILFGIDHLLYILAMLCVVSGWRRIVATMTAFTLTHSITLSAAALGFVHVPGRPVEAMIALSIVYVAREIVLTRQGRPGLTQRYPWVIAFIFGLLHGFGFAGALSEVGLPANDIPLALLFFNIGVEAGQLAFVAATLGVIALLNRVRLPKWAPSLPPYAIGSIAMFWVIQRTLAIW